MKFPRFTVRRLMVAVALVAVLIGTARVLDGRRRRFARLANDYGLKAIEDRKAGRAGRNLQQFEKYIYAAHHPWLPVEPDPPGPAWPSR
jgi:hypothetical protein